MTAVNERQSFITAMEKVLSNDGWNPDEGAQLSEEVGWTPDRIFTRTDGKKLALEVEEEVNIPRFLIRRITANEDHLRDTKILVASIRNSPLKITTAKTGIQNGISIYAGVSNPSLVLDSSFPGRLATIPSESVNPAFERFNNQKRIPLVLIRELENLNRVSYARDLRQFAHDYESVIFNNWEQEHQHVHDFIIDRFGDQLSTSQLFEGLNVLALLEEVSEIILGKRPHFLHSFQTFLLGSIIIDKNYELFQRLYSAKFEGDQTVNIDLPWFFTSLFHDLAAPFENIESMGPVGQLSESRTRGISGVYTPHLLGCLFEKMNEQPIDPEWIPEPDADPGRLHDLLSKFRFGEHGVIGAINLISSVQNMQRKTLATVIYPSALAVSVHSSHLWNDLVANGLFPVDVSKFPLIFLILLCDNIEEWGREMHHVIPSNRPHVLITGLNFDNPIVKFKLWVNEPERAVVMQNRCDWITQSLFNMGNLRVECEFLKSANVNGE